MSVSILVTFFRFPETLDVESGSSSFGCDVWYSVLCFSFARQQANCLSTLVLPQIDAMQLFSAMKMAQFDLQQAGAHNVHLKVENLHLLNILLEIVRSYT